jgi:hypothetical protein
LRCRLPSFPILLPKEKLPCPHKSNRSSLALLPVGKAPPIKRSEPKPLKVSLSKGDLGGSERGLGLIQRSAYTVAKETGVNFFPLLVERARGRTKMAGD